MWATASWGQRAFHANKSTNHQEKTKNKSTNHRGKPKSKHLSLGITQCVMTKPRWGKKIGRVGGSKKIVCVCVWGCCCPIQREKIGRVYFSKNYILNFGFPIFEIMATWPWAEAMELRPAVQKENFCPWFQIRIGSEINLTLYWPNWHYIDQSQIWDHFGPF